MPGPSRGGGRLGTEALHPRVPRRSQQELVESQKLADRLQEQKNELQAEYDKQKVGARCSIIITD